MWVFCQYLYSTQYKICREVGQRQDRIGSNLWEKTIHLNLGFSEWIDSYRISSRLLLQSKAIRLLPGRSSNKRQITLTMSMPLQPFLANPEKGQLANSPNSRENLLIRAWWVEMEILKVWIGEDYKALNLLMLSWKSQSSNLVLKSRTWKSCVNLNCSFWGSRKGYWNSCESKRKTLKLQFNKFMIELDLYRIALSRPSNLHHHQSVSNLTIFHCLLLTLKVLKVQLPNIWKLWTSKLQIQKWKMVKAAKRYRLRLLFNNLSLHRLSKKWRDLNNY